MIYIFIEWCIDQLDNNNNIEYLEFYQLYKTLISINKILNYNYYIKFNPKKITSVQKLVYQKNHLLSELPNNTILYPYGYCPINHLHGVLQINIRANTIVYQCGKCNSVIVPRLKNN